MEKTILEKAIELRANANLEKEYEAFFRTLNTSMFNGLKVEEKNFCGWNNDNFFTESMGNNKNPKILEFINKRREILIKEETTKLLNNLDSIKYLFEQHA